MTADDPAVDARPDDTQESARSRRRSAWSVLRETVLLLGFALVLAVVIKALLVQAFYIPSESMEPGLVKNDRILVQKASYWFGEPQRGDVIVFKDPGGWLSPADDTGPTTPVAKAMAKVGLYPSGGHLVKRVIGVAGDTISCCDTHGRVKVNGVALDEPYVNNVPGMPCNGPKPNPQCNWTAGPVPKGRIFVMGDNRSMSADSSFRLCPPGRTDCTPGQEYVATDLVVGKVFVLLWPFDHFHWFGRPATFDKVPSVDGPDATAP